MTSGKTVLVTALALGLIMAPLAVSAENEKGEKEEQSTHHETVSGQVHEGTKKASKVEAKKTNASSEGTSTPHHDDSTSEHEEELEEGSH